MIKEFGFYFKDSVALKEGLMLVEICLDEGFGELSGVK